MRAIVPCFFSFPFRFPADKGDLNGISTRISNLTFNDYWRGNIRIVIKNESPIQLINLILGAFLVQPRGNQHGKDGFYAHYGQEFPPWKGCLVLPSNSKSDANKNGSDNNSYIKPELNL